MLPLITGNNLNSKDVANNSLLKITILSRARMATPICAIWLGHMAHMFMFRPLKFVTDEAI